MIRCVFGRSAGTRCVAVMARTAVAAVIDVLLRVRSRDVLGGPAATRAGVIAFAAAATTAATTAAAAATTAAATTTAAAATTTTTAATATATTTVVAATTHLHLGDDLAIVFGGQRVVRAAEDLILALDVRPVRLGEPGRGVEQRLARDRACLAVEIARGGGDIGLHRDLRRMLGGQLRERLGQLGPAGRQPREHRAFLVHEVPRDGTLEVRHGVVDALVVAVIRAARRKSSRSVQQRRHHFVVAAVRSLELREAGKLHTGQGSTAGGAATSAGRD